MELTQRPPALRPLDVAPFRNESDELFFALHDLTHVAPQSIAVSLPAYFLMTLLDGRNTCQDMQAAFLKQFGQTITSAQIEELVTTLDRALLLDSAAYERAYASRQNEYLLAEARDNRARYPSGPELRAELEELLASGTPAATRDLRGVIAPHLDYARGSRCYADAYATLQRCLPAERFVILGTNHFGRSSAAVATTKDFHTPLGRVTTDRGFIARLETTLGQSLCEHQFDHDSEHSIELQVHLLQVCQPQRPFTIVPVLCPDPSGPTGTVPYDGRGPDLGDFADALADLLRKDERRTLVIAGADLSHFGQHFGDEEPSTPELLAQVRGHDERLLALLGQRQDEAFVESIRAVENVTRICSVGCIYTLLRALPDQPCRVLRYDQAVNMAAETHVSCAAAVIGT